jgi:hypothetical protein
MERAVTGRLRADRTLTDADLLALTVGDLPADEPDTAALLRRRAAIGLPLDPRAPVLVDADGRRPDPGTAALFLRRARSVRISIDGNAHFCRGLLATRYPGAEADQAPRPDPDSRTLLPLEVLS